MRRVAFALISASVLLAPAIASADLRITTLSSRADAVSGSDVLVSVSGGEDGSSSGVKVTLNGHDVSSSFHAQNGALVGLVEGLTVGKNVLSARGGDGGSASLTVTDYPITGPIFSGPHEEPFYCMTQLFKLPASTTTLGTALDADCSIATRVDYVYRSTAGTYKPLPSTSGGYPTDLAMTTTSLGKTVPYIVRVETGTIDRAIYETAVLHDPTKEGAPSPFAPPAAWNHRLVYTLGGGCVGGWYIQGSSLGNGGILEDLMLRQGFGVASSSLNVFGNNCQEVLAAEALSMVKERFIKNFGAPVFTIGYGCSGGSEQADPISDDYPGLMQGIITGCTFPELTAGMVNNIGDADLWYHYLQGTTVAWTAAQQIAATGYPTTTTLLTIGPGNNVRTKAQGGSCNSIIPVATQYDAKTNPKGVRCDIYDHMVNIWGRDPKTGFARRPLDNEGVQYGLAALNAGTISKAQFLDVNKNIGGFDSDGNYIAGRTAGDVDAMRIAYQTGRIDYTGKGQARTPDIDYRGYVDQPENGNEVHSRFHSFSIRARMVDANGDFDNQVMLIENGLATATSPSTGLFGDTSPVLSHALTQMDEWLTTLGNDRSEGPFHQKLVKAKPSDLVDACYTNTLNADGSVTNTKHAELQVYKGNTFCNSLYPAFSTPRMVAGEPVENNVLKCRRKHIDTRDYAVSFTAAEQAQLASIFPTGVCDYSKPGVEQQPTQETWVFFPVSSDLDE
jgi:hypothetical protein